MKLRAAAPPPGPRPRPRGARSWSADTGVAGAGAGLAAIFAFGCSSATPPNGTPTVAIAAPPAASSAPRADTAPPEATTGTETEEPAPDCGALITAAKAASADTIEDCREIGRQVFSIRQTCDSEQGGDANVWAVLESADCMEDLGARHLTALSKALPAATAAKLDGAESDLKGEIGQFCTRDCGMIYGANCTTGVLACMDTAFVDATSGNLDVGAASKVGKDTQVFAPQADALCALPASAWRGGKAPARCTNAVLSWLQACADPAHACPNP